EAGDGGRVVGRVAGCRPVLQVAAAERVVGARVVTRQRLGEQGVADRTVLGVQGGGARVQHGAFPIEAGEHAAHAAHDAVGVVVDRIRARGFGGAVAADAQVHAFVGDVQAGQAVGVERTVGQVLRAERIPVIGGGHDDRRGGERGGLFAHAFVRRLVVAHFAEGDEVVVDVVFDRAEQVVAVQPAQQVALRVGVEAQRAVHGGALRAGLDADVVVEQGGAAVGNGLDVEAAAAVGDVLPVLLDLAAVDGLEHAPCAGGG